MPKLATLHQAQNGRCFYCSGPMYLPNDSRCSFERRVTRDHRVPLSKGGRGGPNIVGACYQCNSKKGNLDEDEWMAAQPAWLREGVAEIRAQALRSERAFEKWEAAQQKAAESPKPVQPKPSAPAWHFLETKEYEITNIDHAAIRWATMARSQARNKLYVKLCALRGEEPYENELRI